MNFISKNYNKFREFYAGGLNSVWEFWTHIAHVTTILAILILLWGCATIEVAIMCTILGVLYISILGICGYINFRAYYSSSMAISIYFNLSCILLVIGCFETTPFITMTISAIILSSTFILGSISKWINWNLLYEKDLKNSKSIFKRLWNQKDRWYMIGYIVVLVLLIWLPVMTLQISTLLKLLIVAVYLLSIPIIAGLANKGVNIEEMFE